MDELIRQFLDLLQTRIITLGEEPVKVIQIVLLIGTLAAALIIGGFLRRWFRRLFIRFRMPEDPQESIACDLVPYCSGFWELLWHSSLLELAQGSSASFLTTPSQICFSLPRVPLKLRLMGKDHLLKPVKTQRKIDLGEAFLWVRNCLRDVYPV